MNDKQWLVFIDDDGEICIAELSQGTEVALGQRYGVDSAIAKMVGSEDPITLLVICNEKQNNLFNALEALDAFTASIDANFFTFEVGRLIETALKGISRVSVS